MSSVEHLRVFVNERLTAAAEEIFRVFKETIVEYEEEISRQSRLLDIVWKPHVKLHRIEPPQQHACMEEEDLIDQQIWNQERKSTLDQEDPEPLQIKEEQEELCTSQEEKQLVLKLETDAFLLTPTHEENDHSDPEPKGDHQLLCSNSHAAENQDQKRREDGDLGSARNAESKPEKRPCKSVSNDTYNSNLCSEINTCGKRFSQPSSSNARTRVHTGEKPYSCKICGKRFTVGHSLKQHIRIHTGERPYICPSCGKDFSLKCTLSVHMKTHSDKRPYLCKTCGKDFKRSDALSVHMRLHTGEKPYACEYCEKRFREWSSWTEHMRIHTGEKLPTCATCGKDFRQSYHLKTHMRIHTGEKPFTCKSCGKKFSDRSAWRRHTRTHTD